MYPSMTLYPGGAFLYCESVSEFDPNVPPTLPAGNPMTNLRAATGNDPVTKVTADLQYEYENHLLPLMNMDYSYNPETAITDLETLIVNTSTIFNSMIKQIGKITGIATAVDSSDIVGANTFYAHLGEFMKNATKIHQQGIANYDISWQTMPAFERGWHVMHYINWTLSHPEMLDKIITGPMWNAIIAADAELSMTFDGPIDMLKCMLTDPDRVLRLEVSKSKRFNIDALIARSEHNCECYIMCAEDRNLHCAIFKEYSRLLKKVSTSSYQLQCDITEGRNVADIYMSTVRSNITAIVNMFSVGAAYLFMMAYRCREVIATERGLEAYTSTLLNVLKTT